jgi:membrane-bound lytic murein transglycosylase B
MRQRPCLVISAFAAAAVLVAGPGLVARQDPAPVAPLQAPAPATPFPQWLSQFRQDALAWGISQRTVDAALTGLEPLGVVTERDRTQPERMLSIDEYLKRRLDKKTVRTAREMAKRHATLLGKVSADYGAPGSIIVSIWGLESNFGRFSGIRPTVAALATLAWDNRRAAMFRQELLAALEILDKGDIDPASMKGSWAGAMGQPQFMPSSYLKYAQDFDKDGRRDIWGSPPDVFASIANFLKQSGWVTGKAWGRAVVLPKGEAKAAKIDAAAPLRSVGCEAMRQMSEGLAISRWRALGVADASGTPLPASESVASLLRVGPRSYLVYDNYSVLLQYNCAHAYALAVALLADKIPSK